jgi:hypothetical protein
MPAARALARRELSAKYVIAAGSLWVHAQRNPTALLLPDVVVTGVTPALAASGVEALAHAAEFYRNLRCADASARGKLMMIWPSSLDCTAF